MSEQTPTIREIAKVCGCNNSTVSRALNNKSNISAATRERVQRIARSMGWKPNPIASAYIAHCRSGRPLHYQATLAYILENESLPPTPGIFYRETHFQGAQKQAAKLGYKLEPIRLSEVDYDTRRISSMIQSRGIPGVIIPDVRMLQHRAMANFDWDSFALATSGHVTKGPFLHRSAFYWPHGMRTMVERVRECGYRHIALIISRSFDELTDHGLTSEFYHYEKHCSRGESYQSFIHEYAGVESHKKVAAWLQENRPEVVIATGEAWRAIQWLGWKVPDDIAFVSPHWSTLWPHIAGLNQNWELLGANTVELLSAQIHTNERGIPQEPKMLFNDGFWVDGPSLPSREGN